MRGPDYPLWVDDLSVFSQIIRSFAQAHLQAIRSTPRRRPQEDVMVELPRSEKFAQATEITYDKVSLQAPAVRRTLIKRSALALALLAGYGYWTSGRYIESTDDAHVKADYTTVAPKVAGYIAEVAGAG
jgi:hypothetical protein